MKKTGKEEIREQLRQAQGQSQWTRWSNRVEKLSDDVDTYAFWAIEGPITSVCDGMPGVHAALLVELEKARAHLATLAEFAPKPKGRKKAGVL